MASKLRNRLKTASGQLAETSMEELSKQAGRTSAPTAPLEGSVLGGNKDQAKMLGTPAQRTSALRSAIQGEQNLETALRRGQVRREATQAETAKMGTAERLQGLGSLESRVDEAVARGLAQSQELALAASTDDLETAELLERIQEDPSDTAAIIAFSKAVGRDDPNNPMTAAEIIADFGVTVDPATGEKTINLQGEKQIGEAIATSVQEEIDSGVLKFEEMGFSGIEEVAGLVGTDVETLRGMSLEDFQNQLNMQIQQEYSTAENLRQRLNDPSLGAAERAEARQQLREMGAVGIKSAESNIDRLADDIAQANTVDFMGEELTTEELLDNDFISGIVSRALSDPEGFGKELKETEPELHDFIKRHEQTLLESVEEIEPALEEYSAIQLDNLQLKGNLSDDLASKLMPGYDELAEVRHTDPDSEFNVPAAVSFLNSEEADIYEQENLGQALETINKVAPDYAADLANLSEEELRNLGAMDISSPKWNETLNALTTSRAIKSLDVSDPDAVARASGYNDAADMQKEFNKAVALASTGLGDVKMKDLFDRFGINIAFQDKLDFTDIGTMLQKKYGGGTTLQDTIDLGNQSRSSWNNLKSAMSENSLSSAASSLAEKVSPFINTRSQAITLDEAKALAPTLSLEEMDELGKSPKLSRQLAYGPNARLKNNEFMRPARDKYEEQAMEELKAQIPGLPDNYSFLIATTDDNLERLNSIKGFLQNDVNQTDDRTFTHKVAQEMLNKITRTIDESEKNQRLSEFKRQERIRLEEEKKRQKKLRVEENQRLNEISSLEQQLAHIKATGGPEEQASAATDQIRQRIETLKKVQEFYDK